LHAEDPARNWKSKDCAIYLVTSLATKKQTAKHGATQASELVNLTDFFNNQILPELKSPNIDLTPVLKADALKYVAAFRNMLSRDILIGCLPFLIHYLKAKSVVVHTYAAYAIERIFTLKNPGGAAPVSRDEVKPILEELLVNLFKAFEIRGSEENEYIMKAIMRTFSMMQEDMSPYMADLLTQLIAKLAAVSKNPSKPQFNHYLFESLSCAVRFTGSSSGNLAEFENGLFPVFTEIIRRDVTEFLPYVFQVLSLLLELRKDGLPDTHMGLFPFLLSAAPWERPGNIPPMVRLLQAYIKKAPGMVTEEHKLGGLLGVFQKLIASKTNDHEGFYILNTLVESVDQSVLAKHIQQIFILLFQRLSSSKTTKYVKGLLVFLSLYASKYGAATLAEIVDSLQKKLFGMVLEKLYIAEVQKVCGTTERKICAVGIINILTQCPVMLTEYNNYWAPLLNALLAVFELPEDTSTPDDEHFIEIEDTPGYQAAYCQLAFAGSTDHDPFSASIPDAKIYLAQCLNKLSTAHPGKVTPMIKSSLSPDALACLQKYFTAAGVTLS
ncbi:exportin-2-like, partial [Paramuricea clavata]